MRPERINILSTLDPSRLTETDLMDISGFHTKAIFFQSDSKPPGDPLRYLRRPPQVFPFPPRTRGFLYFKSDADLSPLAGGVRFRITPNDAPSSFPEGRDLLLPSGVPWQVMLATIAVRGCYPKMRDQILRENLASPEQISQCQHIFETLARTHPHRIIFNIKQSFLVTFSSAPSLWIVGTAEMLKARLPLIFCETQGEKRVHPYGGELMIWPCNDLLSY